MTELEKLLSTADAVGSFTELVVKNYPNVVIKSTKELIDKTYLSSGISDYNHFYYVNSNYIDLIFESYGIIIDPRDNTIMGIYHEYEGIYHLNHDNNYIILSHEAVNFSNLQTLWNENLKAIKVSKFRDFALTKLKPVLDEVYGENYDLQVSSNGYLDLLIRYPHITITNSEHKTREIEELYCVLTFNDSYLLTQFLGFRAKMSFNDVKNGYRHSHLNSRSLDNLFDLSSFCTGSTDLTALISEFREGFNEDRFDLFLYQINNFVEWESIEGTPYIYLNTTNNRNLTVTSRQSIPPSTIISDFNKFCNAFKENPDLFNPLLNYNNSGNSVEVTIQNAFNLARALAPYSTYYGYIDSDGNVQTNNIEQYDYALHQQQLDIAIQNAHFKTFRNNPINYEATIIDQQAEVTAAFCSEELLSFTRETLQQLFTNHYTSLQTEDVYLSRDNIENLVLVP